MTQLPPQVPTRFRQCPERDPPSGPFVTLSEAVSWIAFRHALDSDKLHEAIVDHPAEVVDMQSALADAVAKLAHIARGGSIALRGKYVNWVYDDERTILTAAIDPIHLHNFARFDVCTDALRHGTGLMWANGEHSLERAMPSGRRDLYADVWVERDALVKWFPGKTGVPSGMEPYTNDEIVEWINDHPAFTNQKVARNQFMQEARARGLSATFEVVWNQIKQGKQGRPRKAK